MLVDVVCHCKEIEVTASCTRPSIFSLERVPTASECEQYQSVDEEEFYDVDDHTAQGNL